jgi:ELWxxDGT repeat protein
MRRTRLLAWLAPGLLLLSTSSGLAQPAYRVLDIVPGPDGSFPETLGGVGDVMAFTIEPQSISGLWLSDGTAAGTVQTAPACGPCIFASAPSAALGGLRFFPGRDAAHGLEPWVTDGTPSGTHLVADLAPGFADSEILSLTTVGGRVFMGIRPPAPPFGSLWTMTTTQPPSLVASAGAEAAAAFKGELFFRSGDARLWRSDGTPAGTVQVSPSALPGELMPAATNLYFSGSTGALGTELWKTDGTAAGTSLVLDICPGFCSGLGTPVPPIDPASKFAVIGDTLYFVADDGVHGAELWRSDGTPAGTTMVADIWPGPFSSGPAGLVVVDGKVLFGANDGTSGYELWRSDGTPAGTVRVADIVPGSGSGVFSAKLHRAGGEVFFAAQRPAEGVELWKSDGTGPGTVLVHDIAPGPASSTPRDFAVAGPRVFFAADDGTTGTELWAADVRASLSVSGTILQEGNAGTTNAVFEVALTGELTAPATVNYATVGGSATSGVDFVPTAGTLTFGPGGALSLPVTVAVNGDLVQEADESFRLQLFGAVGVALDVDSADAVILDDDGPTLAIADQVVLEGNSGTVNADFTVTLRTANGGLTVSPTMVAFEAHEVTASSPGDFDAVSGTVTFPAGTPDGTVNTFVIPVRGDTIDEPDESFRVDLTPLTVASLSDGSGRGVIRDDDGSPGGDLNGLTHGSVVTANLESLPGPAPDADWYLFPSAEPSSYEVIVDEVSGDIEPLSVDLLQPGEFLPAVTSMPVGLGAARSLRWSEAQAGQKIRVRSGGCLTDCGADDRYRLRAYDTSYAIPRYNSTGGQVSLVIVQNRTDQSVTVTVRFWSEQGFLVGETQQLLNPRGSAVLATPANTSGGVTVAHNGGYGALAGKSVTIEQATGFSFDSTMEPRRR